MNELAVYQPKDLPAKPEDLAKFILFAFEKAKSLKAEIRAIQKLDLAKDVYDQKLMEQKAFQELILAASQKMGELSMGLPKDTSFRGNQHTMATSRQREVTAPCKPKPRVIQDLGLSTSQVHRFEQMAAHPDIVEGVIADSKAGLTQATQEEVFRRIKEQTNVLDLAKARRDRYERDIAQID